MGNFLDGRVILKLGDITQFDGDGIVNAANTSLLGGGGVDGAIHRAAGSKLLEECKGLGGVQTGEVKLTKSYDLSQLKGIIHTAGPIWQGGHRGEADLLRSCYLNSLLLAESLKYRSLAFPAISTGVYGFPLELACKIVVDLLRNYLSKHDLPNYVYLYCFDQSTYNSYKNFLKLK